jgi:hypothetical protein
MKAIPVGSGHDALASLEHARQELRNGHVVCIFAEGSISRTGNMLPLKRGFERIADGQDVPVIPVYLDRVWGSIFSFKGGRFFWKWPVRVPYPVTVAFGQALPSTTTAAQVRLALQTLSCDLATARRPSDESLGRQFVEQPSISEERFQWPTPRQTDVCTRWSRRLLSLGATSARRRDERRVLPSGIRRRIARERGDLAVG